MMNAKNEWLRKAAERNGEKERSIVARRRTASSFRLLRLNPRWVAARQVFSLAL